MSFTKAEVNRMLESLDEEDLQRVIVFIQFLLDTRKKKRVATSKNILEEIQRMFQDDERWDNEERMIADMAVFRKERIK